MPAPVGMLFIKVDRSKKREEKKIARREREQKRLPASFWKKTDVK